MWRGRAARRRRGVVRRRGATSVKRSKTRKVPRRHRTPARASRGGIGNGFGGSGGLLVRHDDWCCCFLSLGLRARVRVDSCGSFAALNLSSSARRRRGVPPAAFLALFRARTAICAFGRWIMTLYSTLCSVLLAIYGRKAKWMRLRAKCKPFESGRPRSGRRGAATRRTSPRSTPGEKLALGQVHQSD